jgi:2',3'-cyclic-nucleotide 2'-phosphodiesterase (5'-nucleotidase family)
LLSPVDLMVEVTEKDGKRSVKWTPNFRFIDTVNVTPDPEAQALADEYSAKLDATLNVEIGTVEAEIDSRRNTVRAVEATMGNLIADAMRAQTGADIAIMNGGGIRGDRTYDVGTKLTRRDILTELPFGNVTVVTELPGAQVLAALENGVSQVEKGAGRFAQVSGLTFVLDPSAEPGKRVSEVMVAGAPLEADKLYTVAVNDYILGGGDGYAALGGGRVVTNSGGGNLVANDVMAYVEKLGSVKPAVEGRIRIMGQ